MSQAKTVKEVLTAVEWMLKNIGWCQNTAFRDEQGNMLFVEDVKMGRKRPASMCLGGAIGLVEAESALKGRARILLAQTMSACISNVASFNDSHTKQQVLAVVRKAKEQAT